MAIMKCETPDCKNIAVLLMCPRCLWLHSEELYKADRERREKEAKSEEIKAEIAYVWDLWERIPEDHFLERYSLAKRARELWAEIESEEQ